MPQAAIRNRNPDVAAPPGQQRLWVSGLAAGRKAGYQTNGEGFTLLCLPHEGLALKKKGTKWPLRYGKDH